MIENFFTAGYSCRSNILRYNETKRKKKYDVSWVADDTKFVSVYLVKYFVRNRILMKFHCRQHFNTANLSTTYRLPKF